MNITYNRFYNILEYELMIYFLTYIIYIINNLMNDIHINILELNYVKQ